MIKLLYIVLLLSLLPLLALSQDSIILNELDPIEHYDWVKNFNEKNMSNRVINKNDKTHQLDSSISYLAYYEGGFAGSIDFSKDRVSFDCSYPAIATAT